MIARDLALFLLLVIVPFLFFDLRYFRRYSWWKRILCWAPCMAMVAYTFHLAMERDFIPANDRIAVLYVYLALVMLMIAPMLTFIICSLLGKAVSWLYRKCRPSLKSHPPRNYGNFVGILSIPAVWFVFFWGSFVGFNKLDVNHIEYVSEDLPKAFDGYRIVQFSDAHVGSYMKHNDWVLQKAIDSINAQKPDMIVFTGDLQNIQPSELYPHMEVLSQLKAKDGIYSVLGNHDYADYLGCDEAMKVANVREMVSLQQQMGWKVLRNEHLSLERDGQHIIVAGMENDGNGKKFPQRGDITKTLEGVAEGDFILMLEHDPFSWRHRILPESDAQLTLSGHTHNMQFNLFGWCPLSLTGREYNGWYREGRQSLFVTAGVGGLIPFRFGATGEIVVLTLRTK
ncbi:MAG: metallophosphoesterase [Prevotella sp.]|nr:metallophosphoesterase [Prevotella sp.]